jgi:Raf kinase inhibitor-like YbhB/YbcL family protein
MGFTASIRHGIGKLLRPVHAGDDKLAARRLRRNAVPELDVTSPAFSPNGPIPKRHTRDGEDLSPPLRWGVPPAGTREVVLIVEDPDAPFAKPYVHWLAYALPPNTTELPEGVSKTREVSLPPLRQLRNSDRREGWAGPAPPSGHGVHHYHIQVFALSEAMRGFAGQDREALLDAMRGHVLAHGVLVGTYERP